MAIYECRFMEPIHEDADIGSGDLHPHYKWLRLQIELIKKFGAWTRSPGLYEGAYTDPDTGQPVADKSREYRIALREEMIPELREYLKTVAIEFKQKVIYFYNGKEVEYIYNPERYPERYIE